MKSALKHSFSVDVDICSVGLVTSPFAAIVASTHISRARLSARFCCPIAHLVAVSSFLLIHPSHRTIEKTYFCWVDRINLGDFRVSLNHDLQMF